MRTRPQTTKTYRTTAELHILPALGEMRLTELTAGTITAWLREVRAGPTPSVVESAMTVLRRISKYAAQQRLTQGDLLFGVDIPPKVKRERDDARETITPTEARRVLNFADNHSPSLGLIMRIIAETGARPGEVLALHEGQLHPDGNASFLELHGTVVGLVRGGAYRQAESKTATSHRLVAVSAGTMNRLMLAIQESRSRFPDPEPQTGIWPVFPTVSGGWKSVNTLNHELRNALEGTDVVGISPRVFRRTLATAVAASTGDLDAASLLGHARPSTTGRHYIRPAMTVRDGATTLARFLGESTPDSTDL